MNPASMQHICLRCDHVMPEPSPACTSCGAERSPHWRLPTDARFGAFEVKTGCPHCGNPIVLGGPVLHTSCDSCQRRVDLPPELWRSILENLDEDYHLFQWGSSRSSQLFACGFSVAIEYGKQVPSCPDCHKTIPYVEVGTDARLPCERCSRPLDVFPAPAWLRQVVPTAVQLYAADRELDGTAGGAAPVAPADDTKPVLMPCPGCAASLSLDAASPRVTTCAYCRSDVYLPDALWQKLHPVRTVTRFGVRFAYPFPVPDGRPPEIEGGGHDDDDDTGPSRWDTPPAPAEAFPPEPALAPEPSHLPGIAAAVVFSGALLAGFVYALGIL